MGANEELPSPLKKDPRDEVWANWQGAVLLRDEIKRYCENDVKLIDPFLDDKKFLKPASYHLRLGNRCRVSGDNHDLSAGDPILKIPPHGIAIVRTLEKVNIPGFLIARWNLKVKKVYKGLVWVGSLQVDPGYSGYLFCPLYNLSNEEQRLEYGERLFTIDFVRTTFYDESKGCELWKPIPARLTDCLGALDTDKLKSAPEEQFDKMRKRLEASEEKVGHFQSRIDNFQAITFIVLGIIVAALSFVGVSKFGALKTESPSGWQMASWIIVLVAILILTGVLAYAGVQTICRSKKRESYRTKGEKTKVDRANGKER